MNVLFEGSVLLENETDWFKFTRSATLELAKKYHEIPERYPCLAIRVDAEPDDGPGAPDKEYYIYEDEIDELKSRLLKKRAASN